METERTFAVSPTNENMAVAWDGPEGERWAENAERLEATSSRYDAHVLRALAVADGDHLLEVGCGNGGLALAMARATPSGSVLGVDLSGPMIANARGRATATEVTNVSFEQGDVQVYPFVEGAFDAAVSRFGAMFFGEPVQAFSNIARAIRRGGRLVLLCWQGLAENEWLRAVRDALALDRQFPDPAPGVPGPMSLADPVLTERVLTEAGFIDVVLDDVSEPTYWGRDPDDAFAFVRTLGITQGLLEGLPPEAQREALERLRALLGERHRADGVWLGSRAWLITARKA